MEINRVVHPIIEQVHILTFWFIDSNKTRPANRIGQRQAAFKLEK